jgi:Mce-associated membrane protein
MTSYDHRSVEEDFSWIQEDGTEKFEKTFEETTRPIRTLIRRTRASAEGTVTEAAGDARDADHVTVVMFVDQTLTRAGDREPALDSSRVVMEMVREDGDWLVDQVELR